MTAPSSWRRSVWRIGSMLAALVGSAVVVAAVLRRAPAPRPRPSTSSPGTSDDGPSPTAEDAAAADSFNGLVSGPPRTLGRTAPADAPPDSPPVPPGTTTITVAPDETNPVTGQAPGAFAVTGGAVIAEEDRTAPAPGANGLPAGATGRIGDAPDPATATNGRAATPVAPASNGVASTTSPAGRTEGTTTGHAEGASPSATSEAVGADAARRVEAEPGVGDGPVPTGTVSPVGSGRGHGVAGPAGRNDGGSPGDGRRRSVGVMLAVVGAAVIGAVAVVAVAGGDDGPDTTSGDAGGAAAQPTTTSVDVLTPDQAFVQAAERLTTGGSFGYHGTSSATDVSHVRPGPWLGVELTVIGQVDLTSGRWRELAISTASGEVAESVTDGVTLWARRSPSPEQLEAAAVEPLRPLADASGAPVPTGGALLPGWLLATTNRVAEPTPDPAAGATGRRTFRATLPAAALGEVETGQPPVDAQVRLTLDAAGNPLYVDLVTAPTGPPLHLALNIAGIGEPEPIDLPPTQPAP